MYTLACCLMAFPKCYAKMAKQHLQKHLEAYYEFAASCLQPDQHRLEAAEARDQAQHLCGKDTVAGVSEAQAAMLVRAPHVDLTSHAHGRIVIQPCCYRCNPAYSTMRSLNIMLHCH